MDGKYCMMELDNCKRVAIFVVLRDIGSSSSILNFIKSLSREGYIVDIFSPKDLSELFDCGSQNINFYPESSFDVGGVRKNVKQIFIICGSVFLKLGQYIKTNSIKKGIEVCLYHILFTIRYFKILYYCDICGSKKYTTFIAIEKLGLVLANLFNYNKVPLIYYSLELYYTPPLGIQRFAFNAIRGLEILAHRNAIATIIQDADRAKFLFDYNSISEGAQEILYLPVSMIGDPFKERTEFLYENLGIPRDKKIFLQLGMIASARMSLELAESAQKWPDDWVLVMHGTFYNGIEHQIKNLNKKGNIFLSKKKILFSDIPKLVSSAHVGLVFYKSINSDNYYNNYYIGSSSGQLAHYLQCGIPIITLNIPSLKKVVDEFQCGIAVSNVDSIEEAAKLIFKNREFFRDRAFICYEAKYCFENHFKNINNFIKSL